MVMRARRGVSLVEAIAAMTLLAAGMLAVATTGARATHLLRRAEAVQGATLVAMSVLDSLTQHESPSAGAATRGRYTLSWRVSTNNMTSAIALVVKYADGAGVRSDTFGSIAARWPVRLHHVP
jgi:Tfp pilus assembly protein PilV